MNDSADVPGSAAAGASDAANRLFESLYGELRALARAQRLRNGKDAALNTTTLVHESYLRFLQSGQLQVEDERHFLAYASHVMRSIVVDHARSQLAAKRGAGDAPLRLNTAIANSLSSSDEHALKVHEGLEALAALDPRMVQVVEMRYFGGLTEIEIAAAMDVSERTVQRLWEKARILLSKVLTET
jgi:RNA polymerase sigma factor (TIGR02999 family)